MDSSATALPSSRGATSFAILGLLSLRTWTSYELAKQVRRSLNWFWPRAERRLYDEPKRLVADGLATATRERTGLRPRTVYQITAEGREELRRWLGTPSAPRTGEFEAMLKVFFADAGSLEQLDVTLARIEAEAFSRLHSLTEMAGQSLTGATEFPERVHIGALGLRMQFEQEEAVLRWARWAREQAALWRSTEDPGDWDHAAVLTDLLRRSRLGAG